MTTVGDLRELLADPDLDPAMPLRVSTSYRHSSWEWDLVGANGTLSGQGWHLTLELAPPGTVEVTEDVETGGHL